MASFRGKRDVTSPTGTRLAVERNYSTCSTVIFPLRRARSGKASSTADASLGRREDFKNNLVQAGLSVVLCCVRRCPAPAALSIAASLMLASFEKKEINRIIGRLAFCSTV